MPLLSFLHKKSKQSSSLPSSTSNASINDDDYVAVSVSSPVSEYHQAAPPSSRLGLPFRNRKQDTPRRSQDLLLEPPPRQSSLFQAYQDRHQGHPGLSTQSLPTQVEKQKQRPEPTPHQRPLTSSKKSLFNWSSKQKSSGTKLSDEILPDDASFNLKAFRHIRPDSPSMTQSSAAQHTPSQSQSPLPPPPIPTTTLPGRESAFQVTSRRPRGNSASTLVPTTIISELTATASTTMTQSQQKMAVAAFLQGARRSATSLSPTDSSPRLSPVRTSFDDRSSVAVLNTPATPPRPPRSQPPGTSTPKLGPEVAQKSSFTTRAAPVKTSNAFGDSDSDTSEEEEEEDADSGVEGIKSSGHSRKRTIRKNQAPLSSPPLAERDSFGSKLGIPHLDLGGSLELNGNGFSDGLLTLPDPVRAWTPPISKSRTETPPPNESILRTSKADSLLTGNVTRESVANSVHSVLTQPKFPPQEQSTVDGDVSRPSLSVYQNGARPRASLSVGALDVSAKEARASTLLAANTRLSNGSSVLVDSANGTPSIARTASPAPTADSTPRPPSRPLNTTFSSTARPRANSDTSESSSSSSSSDDAPLSQLVPPRRPGTAMSSRSDSSPARRPALLSDSSTSLPHSSSASVVGGRKPLVDLTAPSSLTGRKVGMPPPQAKEEEMSNSRKSRLSIETGLSVSTLKPAPNQRALSSDTASNNSRSNGAGAARPNIGSRLQSVAANATGAPHRHHLSPPTAIPNVTPPVPPFLRRESPASSTGDSSSGKAPYTPRDGSRPASIVSASVGKLGHGRKPSVTFEDELDGTVRGRGGIDGAKDRVKEKTKVVVAEEKRKERRRSEARAAIELGKVVNGPPPVDPDDEPPQVPGIVNMMGMQPGGGVWPQMQMQMMPTQMQMMPMMSPMMSMPVSPMMMGMQPNSFPFPDVSATTPGVSASTLTQVGQVQQPQQQQAQLQSGNNAAFLAAHQQAMAIAKQTFQMAVAQQALAAANDEWERSSAVTGFGGGPPQWGGMMSMGPMFPPAPRSMYAGSMGGGAAWGGTGSVYGGTFGMQAGGGVRNSQAELNMPSPPTHLRNGGRQRTKTAPSSQNPPAQAQTSAGRKMLPPSSYKGAR